jgi:hypothetical protein
MPTLYLVAPSSVASWFSHFVEPAEGDEIVFTGEGRDVDVDRILHALEEHEPLRPVLLSSHATLDRDAELTDFLRRRGHNAIGPSRAAAAAGRDKLQMKLLFAEHGIPTPASRAGPRVAELGPPEALVVVKDRYGTQSVGTRLGSVGACTASADWLCELYTDGIEYSVVVYCDDEHELVFPPVAKGATSTALVPPWKRLRVCPDPGLVPARDAELRALARALAAAIDLRGHMEVEYLVTRQGETLVLEINPRVAGTMRLAALAAGVPIFSLHMFPPLSCGLRATMHAAEEPYAGPPIADPEGRVFATIRLTVAAATAAGALSKLRSVATRESHARIAGRV